MSESPQPKEIPEEQINGIIHALTTNYDPALDVFRKNTDLHRCLIELSQDPTIAELDALKLTGAMSADELFIYECVDEEAQAYRRKIDEAAKLLFRELKRKIDRFKHEKPGAVDKKIITLLRKYTHPSYKAFVIKGSNLSRNRAFNILWKRTINLVLLEYWDHQAVKDSLRKTNFRGSKPEGEYVKRAGSAIYMCRKNKLPEYPGETDPIQEFDMEEVHTLTTWRKLKEPLVIHEDGLLMEIEPGSIRGNDELIRISILTNNELTHMLYVDRVSGELRMKNTILKAELPDTTRFRIKRLAITHLMNKLRGMEDNLKFEESEWKVKSTTPSVELNEEVIPEVREAIAKIDLIENETLPLPGTSIRLPKKTYTPLKGKRRANRVIRALKQLLGPPLRQGRHTVFASRNGGIAPCPTHGSGKSRDININTLKAVLAMAGISHREYVEVY